MKPLLKTARFLIAILPGLSACSQSHDVLEPSQNFPRIDYADASWAPTGDLIAYNYNVDPRGTLDTVGLYLFDVRDSSSTKIISGNPRAPKTPEFSPDGLWIAMSWGAQIWKTDRAGNQPVQVTSEGRNFTPSWSPDGLRIAFWRSGAGNVVMNNDGSGQQEVIAGRSTRWMDHTSLLFLRQGVMLA